MTRYMRILPIVLVAVFALALSGEAPRHLAHGFDSDTDGEDDGIFDSAAIFFEYNATDRDLGLHISFEAEDWEAVEVSGLPDTTGRITPIFEVHNGGSLQEIGSTEIDTESAESLLDPANLDAEFAAFLAMFPEGEYSFSGRTVGGSPLIGTAVLSHRIPAPPLLIFPDQEAEANFAYPEDIIIAWADTSGPGDPVIERYLLVVEFEEDETEEVFELSMDLRAGTTSMPIPAEFFESLRGLEGVYKAEVTAIADNGNRTVSEAEFELQGVIKRAPTLPAPVPQGGSTLRR